MRRANSRGATYPKLLCGRSSLYSSNSRMKQLLPTVARIMHYTGVQRGSKDLSGTSEKSVSGNKLGNLAVFLRFSSIADLQSHRLHQILKNSMKM
jgi:hypothetical protein